VQYIQALQNDNELLRAQLAVTKHQLQCTPTLHVIHNYIPIIYNPMTPSDGILLHWVHQRVRWPPRRLYTLKPISGCEVTNDVSLRSQGHDRTPLHWMQGKTSS
jgi:hypothetical protein